jgi:hypothetical protein
MTVTGSGTGFRAFEFDLPPALLKQVFGVLDGMEQGALTPQHVGTVVPEAQGVYQLFHNGKLVYVGKTDAQSGLRRRLERHAYTILSRHKLDVADMSFKAVQVLVFSAMDLETSLIGHYRELGSPSAWNGSGFGSNDPGRNRDKTALREDGFDANYPINIDLPLNLEGLREKRSARELLSAISGRLPYTLRFERTAMATEQLDAASISCGPEIGTMRQVMERVIENLPKGWQATKLSGRVILYRERDDNYPGGEIISRTEC